MNGIGARVKEIRLAKGLSQLALTGEGISSGYVSLIESGKRTPSAATIQRLADRLGVSVAEITGGDAVVAGPEDQVRRESDEARVETNFARMALANGDPDQAVSCLAKIRLDEVEPGTACEAALVLAESLQQTGQLDRAVGVLEAVIERCAREQSWLTLAVAATSLSLMYVEAGDVERSLEVAQVAASRVEAAGLEGTDEHLRLGAVHVLVRYERGDLLHATRLTEELIEVADRVGTSRARGSVYWNAAVVAQSRGRLTEAVQLTDRAVALLGDQDGSLDLPRLRLNYAWLLLGHPSPRATEALEQLDLAESDASLAGSRLDLGTAATFRGRAYLVLGRIDDAAEQAARALTLLGPSEHTERASALILLGDVGTAQLQMDLALESFREAARVLDEMTPARGVARLWRELGDGWRDLGETADSLAAYDRAFMMLGLAPRPTAGRIDALTH